MNKLSIIIVTWNNQDHIQPCLDSVLPCPLQAEVIVVDNGSQDNTITNLKKYGSKINLVKNNGNQGYAKAVNQGLKIADGEYILLLNPDTICTPNALETLTSFLAANPTVWVLGPQLLNMDGTIQPSCRELPDHWIMLYEFTGLSRIFPKSRKFGRWRMGYFDHFHSAEVEQPMGACLMLRREVIDRVGYLDEENFPMFFNEVDWCHRIKKMGGKLYFLPQARVYHHHGASTCQAKRKMIVSSHQSLARYFAKHYPNRISTPFIALASYLSIPLRLLSAKVSRL